MKISLPNLFYTIASVFLFGAILILGKAILIPLGFALLISFILYPMVKKLNTWGLNDLFAAFLSILSIFLFLTGVAYFFFSQIAQLPNELANFQTKLMELFYRTILLINKHVPLKLEAEVLLVQATTWMKNAALPLVQNTFSGTSSFLTGFITCIIYTYLLLIYRKGLTKALLSFASKENQPKVLSMFREVQKVGQKYISGVGLLMLILGFANSVCLWIIGIDSPFLFGFLAAALSIIPYIGTTIGASIPILYAFMTYESLWVPFSVAALFWGIQMLDNNFLSPKVVGNSLQVNALAAIVSLIIGASIWGVAGMVLFLPFASMLKVIFSNFEQTHAWALILGNEISESDVSPKKKFVWLQQLKEKFKKKA
jgi:predicted PurR-regulated permease PerM